ncbi:bifunctional alanine racemase/tRNA (adenosine(37)-N6)-threonylcarbamoyltransferase complex ATPase subunit type 1 TsaE [Arthrobacter sp. H14]|uniref:bifunctional alanine racemase/tRNA (adenosine(37)-N6)-threonylcarbamoyltransferase complex ATPase subunit type 1 TsaE n=1 Tax=Arthrobacter sp. H14 TaxID=1312959 RepID=UPI00047B8110|nr:bifunctional alanine racemase/tRNA (adenosine(37)-N6)-threonylcarbamoyltransferase complex ATPase subunit type 1 TsaE [Arthrobacter sp. H14]
MNSAEREAVVDLAAIRHNVRRLIKVAEPAKVMAVVKADGYGHGAVPVARAAVEAGAAWLGVAHIPEGIALREAGIEAPILAWLHTPSSDFGAGIEAGLDLGVSGWELELIAAAAEKSARPARVHLKIDTGLGRNGCPPDRWEAFIGQALEYQEEGLLRVVGIFSHLAVADEPQRPETDEQIERFREAVAVATDAGVDVEVRHLANSPGTLSRPDTHFDLVRTGIALYGLSPFEDQTSAELRLRPAMTLRTKIAHCKEMPAEHGVSYGLSYRTPAPTTLALVPVGYGDGIPRIASGGPVTVDGRTYPVVGRIAMDQMVIDLGAAGIAGTEQSVLGHEAVLFGPGDDGEESVDAWAKAAGTINYEIVTRISPRIPRRYVDSDVPDDGNDAVAPAWEIEIETSGAEQTQALAARLGEQLAAGDLLVLTGELGAGKTTFTQGLGAGMGVREGIISPTFVLVRIHPNLRTGPDLVHVDAYRLGSAAEIDDIDLENTMDSTVTVVEWGRDRVEHLAGSRLEISMVRSVGGAGEPEASGRGSILAAAGKGPISDTGDDDAVVLDFDDEDDDERRRIRIAGFGPRWAAEKPALEVD